MITRDAQLKLQAHLDGELPAAEAADVKALLARDAEAARAAGGIAERTNAVLGGQRGGNQTAGVARVFLVEDPAGNRAAGSACQRRRRRKYPGSPGCSGM